jgi:hypothetical protein
MDQLLYGNVQTMDIFVPQMAKQTDKTPLELQTGMMYIIVLI